MQSCALLLRDEFWSTVRRLWTPAFSPARLSGYVPLMDKCAGQLVARLQVRVRACVCTAHIRASA